MSTPALSGWCLTRDHRACAYSPCACECHKGSRAGSDRSTTEGHKAAPASATNTRPGPDHSTSEVHRERSG